MKKWIAVLAIALLLASTAIIYSTSTLARDTATATFSKSEEIEGMNTLTIEAPYGDFVIRYDVVPRASHNEQKLFALGARGIGQNPIGLYDNVTVHSNGFPSDGAVDDIPVEEHVRISSRLNLAATAEIPENRDILERCGTYVFVTKDRRMYDQLEAIVSDWEVDEKSVDSK